MSKLREMLIEDEGLELKVYKCPAGKWTLGVGRNVEELGITKGEALFLLDNDIARVRQECQNHFRWFGRLSEPRQDVIVMMVFQLGMTRFKKFRNMIEALSFGNGFIAAEEMLNSKWAREDSPKRAARLAEIMKAGSYKTK